MIGSVLSVQGDKPLTAGKAEYRISAGVPVTALLLGFALLAPAPAAAASGVTLGYEGYLGGLHMLTAEVELMRNETRYHMQTDAVGRGLLSWFVDFSSTAYTDGVIGPDGVMHPEKHQRTIAQSGRKPKIIDIEYRPDGVPMVARSRAGDDAKYSEEPTRRGTMDPMSAVAAIVDQMAAGTRCQGKFAVFDGKWRYDVEARHGEPAELEGGRYTMFAGLADRCDLILKPIDGFEDEEANTPPRGREGPLDNSMALTMWFAAPGPGLPRVPVIASADTDYGGLRIYLARAEALTPAQLEQRASLK